MRVGGGGAGARRALGPEHEGRHAGAVRPSVPLRRVPLRPPVCRHAGGAAGGGAQAVEPGAVAVPAQDCRGRRQDRLPLRLLLDGTSRALNLPRIVCAILGWQHGDTPDTPMLAAINRHFRTVSCAPGPSLGQLELHVLVTPVKKQKSKGKGEKRRRNILLVPLPQK